jgi:predicted O-methyltransferase YrrM
MSVRTFPMSFGDVPLLADPTVGIRSGTEWELTADGKFRAVAGTSFRRSLSLARQRYARLGLRAAVATVATTAVPGFTGRIEQIFGRPTLTQLQRSGPFTDSAREIVQRSIGFDDQGWDEVEEEFSSVERDLIDRRGSVDLSYPVDFAVERQTSLLLYGATRLLKPRCIVETGVADGVSSFFFLAALKQNGSGELHSVDIAPDVGVLADETAQWHLHVFDLDTVDDQIAALFTRESPIDLFFHDSDHSFLGQLFEYETFLAHASNDALLISDDVDVSYGFDTFCKRHEMRPEYLFDGKRKTVGVVRL